jgi:hypothetical protein
MHRTSSLVAVTAAAVLALAALPAGAQKNYTDGGDLYGGAHAPVPKDAQAPAKKNAHKEVAQKGGAAHSGKFDPYTEGAHTNSNLAPQKKTTDNAARSGKFDPYSEGQSSK